MTERTRLTNKIHQLEDKVRQSKSYIDREGPSAYGYKNECKKLERYQSELEAVRAEYEALPKLEDVPAIHSYLEEYGKKVLAWIEKCHELYPLKKEDMRLKEEEFIKNNPKLASHDVLTWRGLEVFKAEYRLDMEELENYRFGNYLYEGRYQYVERDKELKYIDLVEKVKQITGKITDASCLRINEKGSIDGYIDGELGRAKVNTFEAGGWNIQRFHYRTKVTDITNKRR